MLEVLAVITATSYKKGKAEFSSKSSTRVAPRKMGRFQKRMNPLKGMAPRTGLEPVTQ